jgi:hypothetical protein
MACDVETLHLGIADLDPLLVAARVECTLDFQTGLCRDGADQLDDGDAIGERPAAPVLRDVAEQPIAFCHRRAAAADTCRWRQAVNCPLRLGARPDSSGTWQLQER